MTSSKLSVLRNTNGRFSLAFSAPLSSGLAVAAGDVNGDGRQDLYVMRAKSTTSPNAPDQVYLNNGAGFLVYLPVHPARVGSRPVDWMSLAEMLTS